MSTLPKELAQAAIGTGISTIYTVPASTTAVVQTMDVTNTSGADRTVRIYKVPSAGSPGTGNAWFYDYPVPANGILTYTGPATMETGDTIQASADAVGLTITVSGLEVT